MIAIVTKRNADGTFDQVGMKNRIIISHLNDRQAIRRAARRWLNGQAGHIEWFSSRANFYQDAHHSTEEIYS